MTAHANSAATSFGFSKMEVRVRVLLIGKGLLGGKIVWLEYLCWECPPSRAKAEAWDTVDSMATRM